MGIYRIKKTKDFVIIHKSPLNDERLSWKAKGIIAYMLSKPDDWTFYWEELSKHSTDGMASLKSGLKELKDNGYMIRFPIKDKESGKITGWETIVYESPQVENPPSGKPSYGNPPNGKSTTTNIDITKNDLTKNNNIYTSDFETFWKEYPRKIEKKKAFKSFKTVIKTNSLESILNGTKKYSKSVKNTEIKFIKHPATFLNNDSFLNEYEEEKTKGLTPDEVLQIGEDAPKVVLTDEEREERKRMADEVRMKLMMGDFNDT